MKQFINSIAAQLERALPGPKAQYEMAHGIRHTYRAAPDDARIACVLVLIYPKNNLWHIVLIQRMSIIISMIDIEVRSVSPEEK